MDRILARVRSDLIKAKAIANVWDRMAACTELIGELCAAGHIEEAWNLIDSDPGQVRSSQLLRFFKSAELNSAQFLEKWKNLPFRKEESTALRGYLLSLDQGAATALLSSSEFQTTLKKMEESDPTLLKFSLASVLNIQATLPGDVELRKKVLDAAREYLKAGWIDETGFARVVKADTTTGTFERWKTLSANVTTQPTNSEVSKVRKELVESMVDEDSVRALAEISGRGSEKQAHVDLFNALKKWGVVDSVAANQWFTEHQAGMDQVQRDASARAFFELAMTYGEPDGAEQWARKVQNEKLKELLLSKLPKQETAPAEPAR